MSDARPAPQYGANGVPFCARDACPLYDGKRCRGTGFRPGDICEPEVAELSKLARAASPAPVVTRDERVKLVADTAGEMLVEAREDGRRAERADVVAWLMPRDGRIGHAIERGDHVGSSKPSGVTGSTKGETP